MLEASEEESYEESSSINFGCVTRSSSSIDESFLKDVSSSKSYLSTSDMWSTKSSPGGTWDSSNTDQGDIRVREMTLVSSDEESDPVEDIALFVGGECNSEGITTSGMSMTKW